MNWFRFWNFCVRKVAILLTDEKRYWSSLHLKRLICFKVNWSLKKQRRMSSVIRLVTKPLPLNALKYGIEIWSCLSQKECDNCELRAVFKVEKSWVGQQTASQVITKLVLRRYWKPSWHAIWKPLRMCRGLPTLYFR